MNELVPRRRPPLEVNFVFRGAVLLPARKSLTLAAQQLFVANLEVPVLASRLRLYSW